MFENLFVDTRSVLVELSIVPMDGNEQNGNLVADMLDLFEESGLFYEYSRNSASLEGRWEDVNPLIIACYERVHERFPQGYLRIAIR